MGTKYFNLKWLRFKVVTYLFSFKIFSNGIKNVSFILYNYTKYAINIYTSPTKIARAQ